MTTIKILGAAAIIASALAGPAMAQQVTNSGSYQRQANTDQAYRQSGSWQNSYNRWNDRSGFGPGNTAAGTASAMAVEPIGGEEYARRNGFVCIPGTLFRGEDGRRHLCQ
ncbi:MULTISPECIES: hypothetical protein [unclassified Bradyrhizobium]|uniref:hypothetical protein n=1 Tax=unclassified Bradyrhizobium TaxID=2631580 RepID=UPI001BACF2FF|nr:MULTISPECIES: hypothetical protein [unclassified Bradyrhizobium]MBR1226360.1 hypothetical protein [Bradyrhizobium sp. AUGA SZCCT0176]MBR1287582.1 hypothetical protein [Bradyrhizobium sp. AUGA SZCCT0177]MBR1295227.1 hypothetical protein [Bradyrhizobium sp. AUGA SZCCT0042]